MRILTRYVLFDLLKVFLLILTVLTVIIYVVLMGKQAVDMGLRPGPLLRMTPYLLVQALQFTVPGTMLLATTFVFGRMSANNEVVAIKSLGISPMVLIWPTLALATLVSLGGVVLNDLAVSWGESGMTRVGLESLEEIIYGRLTVSRTLTIGRWTISVREVDGHTLRRVVVVEQPIDDKPSFVIFAEEAEIETQLDQKTLFLVAHKYKVEGPISGIDVTKPLRYPVPFKGFAGVSRGSRSPSNYALSEIRPAIKEERQRCDDIQESMAAEASFAMLTGDFDALSDESWKVHRRELAKAEERLHRFHTEPWRRWANGFSCLCFVLIGAPMAIRMRHAEILAIFFVCFLPILIVYYPLMMVSVGQAKDGVVPPPTVWIGNIVLAIWGIWLLRRVIRY